MEIEFLSGIFKRIYDPSSEMSHTMSRKGLLVFQLVWDCKNRENVFQLTRCNMWLVGCVQYIG